jgi:hypothetical protein
MKEKICPRSRMITSKPIFFHFFFEELKINKFYYNFIFL